RGHRADQLPRNRLGADRLGGGTQLRFLHARLGLDAGSALGFLEADAIFLRLANLGLFRLADAPLRVLFGAPLRLDYGEPAVLFLLEAVFLQLVELLE